MSNQTKLVKVSIKTNDLLDALSRKRKDSGELIRTKQDIVAEAINALYKREMK